MRKYSLLLLMVISLTQWASSQPPLLVKDIFPGASGSNIGEIVKTSNFTFLTADDDDANTDRGLFRTDGTSDRTIKLDLTFPGYISTKAECLTPLGDKVIFVGDNFPGYYEIWSSNGTQEGTIALERFQPANGTSFSSTEPFKAMAVLGRYVYYGVYTSDNHLQLRRTDGTAAGTTLVKDFGIPAANTIIALFKVFNNALYFVIYDGDDHIWKSDGTEAGTQLIKDLPATSDIGSTFMPAGNFFYFFVGSDGPEVSLWKSDGTTAGTNSLKIISTLTSNNAYPANVAVGSTLYFVNNTSANGKELWKTDGTNSGTVLVADINPGAASATPLWLTAMNNNVFFSASNGSNGNELWKSNGTTTSMVADIVPGSVGSNPASLIVSKHVLFFSANDVSHGNELWVHDDGINLTIPILPELNFGTASSFPSLLTPGNAPIFFAADNGINGKELFKYHNPLGCETAVTAYRDADNDGYGSLSDMGQFCNVPAGYVTNNTDCDDNNAAINPGITEMCDGKDNNCDGQIDEGFMNITCPQNIVVSTSSQACNAVVSYSAPMPSQNCNQPETVTFNYTGDLQSWTVPSGVYSVTIEAKGAQGGKSNVAALGGPGATTKATYNVTPGEVLQLIVGGKGEDGAGTGATFASAGGGGGGSFIAKGANGFNAFTNTNTLLVAGGGGGGFDWDLNYPVAAHGRPGGSYLDNVAWGGYGGYNDGYAGGGGGIYGDGYNTIYCSKLNGGKAAINGGTGGVLSNCFNTANSISGKGGFGGGGGADWGSGGGGGFTGGSASYVYEWGGFYYYYPSYGGSSFISQAGTSRSNLSGSNTGDGSIKITFKKDYKITQIAGLSSGSTFPLGVTVNTYEIKDWNGNTATCSFTVTVSDNVPPVITSCPVVATQCYVPSGNYTVPALTATDNCGTPSISYVISGATSRTGNGNNASGSFNPGTSIITWTVTDGNGNTRTCSTTVGIDRIDASIPDVFAADINSSIGSANTIYVGYGGNSLTLSAQVTSTVAPNNFTYKWTKGGPGGSPLETNPTYPVFPTENTVYYLSVKDGPCSQVSQTSIQINVVDIRCGANKIYVCKFKNGNYTTNCVQATANTVNNQPAGSYLGECTSQLITTKQSPIDEVKPIDIFSVEAYPNPSAGSFNVLVQSPGPAKNIQFKVLNIAGQLIETRNVKSGELVRLGDNYRPGTYLVEVIQGNQRRTIKLIKLSD